MKRKKAFSALLAILITSLPSGVFSGTFTAFGPQNYTRGEGSPVVVTHGFTVLNPNTTYTLQIYNGGLVDGEFEKVSSSVIAVNGVQVVGPNEFNQNVTFVEKPVTLAGSNELSVELRGKPGGGITIQIIGVDNDPPTIAAAVNPSPNAASWHRSDATVSFTCADSTSGVASCPAPITVSTEGASQLIGGAATDLAGNSATTSLTINLDKTAPSVAITSPSNGATVTSSPVTVTGTATDNLSGIVNVLCNGSSASLSNSSFTCDVPLADGPNTIVVEATDVAGITSISSITVTLGELEPPDPQTSPWASNSQRTLYGENMGDSIILRWALNDNAAEYFVYRSTSQNGPWEQVLRTSQAAARTGGAIEDLTPDARLKDLCYRVDALNAKGKLVRSYEPICVPKYVQ